MDRMQVEPKEAAPLPDFGALSKNMAQFAEEAGKATAAYMRPLEERRVNPGLSDEVGDVVKTLGHVAESWLTDPQKAVEAQSRLGTQFVELWASTLKRMQGGEVEPVARPEAKDGRFQDPEWS